MIKCETLNSTPSLFYLNNKQVEIIKRAGFRLAKVHYLGETTCFYIDENLLTEYKQNEVTICLGILKGV